MPVKPTVTSPRSRALRSAARMFGERPEVDSASSTSPRSAETFDLPREHLLEAVVVGDIAVSAEVSVVSAIAA